MGKVLSPKTTAHKMRKDGREVPFLVLAWLGGLRGIPTFRRRRTNFFWQEMGNLHVCGSREDCLRKMIIPSTAVFAKEDGGRLLLWPGILIPYPTS